MERINMMLQYVLSKMENLDTRLEMIEFRAQKQKERDEWMSQLNRLKEEDNFFTYVDCFVSLVSQVGLSDEDQVALFVGGLNSNKKCIKVLDPKNLQQAILYAKLLTTADRAVTGGNNLGENRGLSSVNDEQTLTADDRVVTEEISPGKNGDPSDMNVELLAATDVAPGNSKLRTSHSDLKMEVRGLMKIQGNPIVEIHVNLFSPEVVYKDCFPNTARIPSQGKAIGHAVADADGSFTVREIPCETYELRLYYKDELIKVKSNGRRQIRWKDGRCSRVFGESELWRMLKDTSSPTKGWGVGVVIPWGGQLDVWLGNFMTTEMEFPVQLAMPNIASDSEYVGGGNGGGDTVGRDEMKGANLFGLGGERRRNKEEVSAEVLSRQYWDYNVLDYEERVANKFYDVYYLFPKARLGNMPLISDLETNPDTGFEVIVVNHQIDHALQELMQVAHCISLDCPATEVALLVQRLAELVIGHLGDVMGAKWMERSTELRTSLHTSVLSNGSIHVGLSRHRAVLFKVPADNINWHCQLFNGSHYTSVEDDAINIIKLDDEREFLVDLMAAPGTLIPADIMNSEEIKAYNPQINSVPSIPKLNGVGVVHSIPNPLIGEGGGQGSGIDNIFGKEFSNSTPPDIFSSYSFDCHDPGIRFSKVSTGSKITQSGSREDSRNYFSELDPFQKNRSGISLVQTTTGNMDEKMKGLKNDLVTGRPPIPSMLKYIRPLNEVPRRKGYGYKDDIFHGADNWNDVKIGDKEASDFLHLSSTQGISGKPLDDISRQLSEYTMEGGASKKMVGKSTKSALSEAVAAASNAEQGDALIDINDRFPRDIFSDIFSVAKVSQNYPNINPLPGVGAGLSLNMQNHEPKHWSCCRNLASLYYGPYWFSGNAVIFRQQWCDLQEKYPLNTLEDKGVIKGRVLIQEIKVREKNNSGSMYKSSERQNCSGILRGTGTTVEQKGIIYNNGQSKVN